MSEDLGGLYLRHLSSKNCPVGSFFKMVRMDANLCPPVGKGWVILLRFDGKTKKKAEKSVCPQRCTENYFFGMIFVFIFF